MGIFVQQFKKPLRKCVACNVAPVQIPEISLPTQLPINASGKAAADGLHSRAPSTYVEDPCGVLRSWTDLVISGVIQRMKDIAPIILQDY